MFIYYVVISMGQESKPGLAEVSVWSLTRLHSRCHPGLSSHLEVCLVIDPLLSSLRLLAEFISLELQDQGSSFLLVINQRPPSTQLLETTCRSLQCAPPSMYPFSQHGSLLLLQSHQGRVSQLAIWNLTYCNILMVMTSIIFARFYSLEASHRSHLYLKGGDRTKA